MVLKEGEEHHVVVEDESEMGDGLTKIDDHVVFLPAVAKGSEFNIKIAESYGKIAFARIKRDKK